MTTDKRSEFPHGGNWAAYEEMCRGEVLDFSANVSPYGLSPSVRAAVSESLANAHRYPDPECVRLRGAIAGKYDLNREDILCGNGAADLIYRLVYAVRPKRALLLAPDFSEYESALRETGCEIIYWEWMKDMNPDAEEMSGVRLMKFIDPFLAADPDMLIFSNPNNPSGCLFEPAFMRELADRCDERNILFAVDECFMDFAEEGAEHSLLGMVGSHRCLCVLRAFTKFYGMAGLRLGWCATSDPELISSMKKAGPPWSVSTPAQAAGTAALSDEEYASRLRRIIAGEREKMSERLRALGMRTFSGKANYILFYTEDENLGKRLLGRGIAIRDCSNYRGLGPGWFRAAVRLPGENEQFLRALM